MAKTKKETCEWIKNHYRKYIIFDASAPAVEYIPGCDIEKKAWDEPPKFCPHCGKKVTISKHETHKN